MKIVMTGSPSDPLDWQPHIRNKPRRELLAKRFKKPQDPLKIVLVRDMWLTGFDAPSLHTMYADKPMRSHGLMQAIARVNRVFKDKPGGLVVFQDPEANAPGWTKVSENWKGFHILRLEDEDPGYIDDDWGPSRTNRTLMLVARKE